MAAHLDRRRPVLGALAVVVHDGQVLLAQRRNPPDAHLWGFPGGHVEFGETALAAAARELLEETGVTATPLGYLTNLDVILPAEGGAAQMHYLLAAVLCRYDSGQVAAADDVEAADWVRIEDVRRARRPMSARVLDLVELALASRMQD